MNVVMENQSNPSQSPSEPIMNTELELLLQILDPQVPYPWNPHSEEGEAYLAALESEWDDAGTEAAIAAGWQALSGQLETLWAEQTTPTAVHLLRILSQQFADRVPQNILQTLSQQAIATVESGRPLINQLVQCAQSVLSDWDTSDLEVLARPLAYSLRDGQGEILDLHLRSVRQVEWSTLSELEQARLSLAIASLALNQAKALSQDH